MIILEILEASPLEMGISQGPFWACPPSLHGRLVHLTYCRLHIPPLHINKAPTDVFTLHHFPDLSFTSQMPLWHFKLKMVKTPTHYPSHLSSHLILLFLLLGSHNQLSHLETSESPSILPNT